MILVLGSIFVQRLPLDLLPRIVYPQVRVNVNNPAAASLYRSFGFQRIRQYQSYRKPIP